VGKPQKQHLWPLRFVVVEAELTTSQLGGGTPGQAPVSGLTPFQHAVWDTERERRVDLRFANRSRNWWAGSQTPSEPVGNAWHAICREDEHHYRKAWRPKTEAELKVMHVKTRESVLPINAKTVKHPN
jgi:hypothetical protein